MLTFNKELLISRLDGLCSRSRTVFALACAERLMPCYSVFCTKSIIGQWCYLRSVADELWDQLGKGVVRPNQEFLAEYPSLAPGDHTARSERTLLDPLAENAVLALGSAWESHISGDSKKAFWAAEQAYEAMDYITQNIRDVDFGEADGELSILEGELVQNELKRQTNDITTLEQIGESDVNYVAVIQRLREQAGIGGQALKTTAEAW
ncbi:MAG: DUF416 family protein [Planctomycetaceae bacterium]